MNPKLVLCSLIFFAYAQSYLAQSLPETAYINGVSLKEIDAPYMVIGNRNFSNMYAADYGNFEDNAKRIWFKSEGKLLPATILTDSAGVPLKALGFAGASFFSFFYKQGWEFESVLMRGDTGNPVTYLFKKTTISPAR